MLTDVVTIVVRGDPIPKGSLKCIGQHGRHQLVEANPRTRTWRKKVAALAERTEARADHWQPVGVVVGFELERPNGHHRTGANAHLLRNGAPPFPVSQHTGDIDKLLRLILDALQDAHLLHDDAQVVAVTSAKRWAGPLGAAVVIEVYPVEGDLAALTPVLAPPRGVVDVDLPEPVVGP